MSWKSLNCGVKSCQKVGKTRWRRVGTLTKRVRTVLEMCESQRKLARRIKLALLYCAVFQDTSRRVQTRPNRVQKDWSFKMLPSSCPGSLFTAFLARADPAVGCCGLH